MPSNKSKPKPTIEEKRRREQQHRDAVAKSLGRPLLYTRRQTAFLLSISVAGVRRLELDGVLTAVKLDARKTARERPFTKAMRCTPLRNRGTMPMPRSSKRNEVVEIHEGKLDAETPRLLMLARREPLQQLETLADCLQRGSHKLSVALVHPYPFALWICRDGRELLVDRNYNPIWQRSPEGYVRSAVPTEWIEGIAHRDVLFDKQKPFYQQYQNMKRLRTVLVHWGYVRWARHESEWAKFKQRRRDD